MTLQPSCLGHPRPLAANDCGGANEGGRIVTFVTFRGIAQDKITRIYNMVGFMHGGTI